MREAWRVIRTENQFLSKSAVQKFVPPMVHLSNNAVTIMGMHRHILVLPRNPNKNFQIHHVKQRVF